MEGHTFELIFPIFVDRFGRDLRFSPITQNNSRAMKHLNKVVRRDARLQLYVLATPDGDSFSTTLDGWTGIARRIAGTSGLQMNGMYTAAIPPKIK